MGRKKVPSRRNNKDDHPEGTDPCAPGAEISRVGSQHRDHSTGTGRVSELRVGVRVREAYRVTPGPTGPCEPLGISKGTPSSDRCSPSPELGSRWRHTAGFNHAPSSQPGAHGGPGGTIHYLL